MSEQMYHALDLAVQLIMVLVVLFGGGKWVGGMNQIVKSMGHDLNEHRDEFADHRREDRENFKEVNDKLNDLAIKVARQR